MSQQKCTIEQSNTITVKGDDEFQNIEKVILKVFKMLQEHDKLMKFIENKKIGGENIE